MLYLPLQNLDAAVFDFDLGIVFDFNFATWGFNNGGFAGSLYGGGGSGTAVKCYFFGVTVHLNFHHVLFRVFVEVFDIHTSKGGAWQRYS